MAKHKIALIPGDGIGKEVLPEGVRVLEAAGRRFNFELEFTDFDWSCDRFAKTGKMMPDDGMEQLKAFDLDLNHIPYNGAGPELQAMMANFRELEVHAHNIKKIETRADTVTRSPKLASGRTFRSIFWSRSRARITADIALWWPRFAA
jgi:isocitrate/isopropylmalate dehydrogenase